MSEVLSDERFIELFGNEPYQDFAPERNDCCAEYAKGSYLGKRPFEFTYEDSCGIVYEWDDLDIVSFYGVLPALLLGMLRVPSGSHEDDWYLRAFKNLLNDEHHPTNFIRENFDRLGYEDGHIEYMIQMFSQLGTMVSDEDPILEKPSAIIKKSIERLQSLL